MVAVQHDVYDFSEPRQTHDEKDLDKEQHLLAGVRSHSRVGGQLLLLLLLPLLSRGAPESRVTASFRGSVGLVT